MTTLYDYIAGLSVGGSPVVWSTAPLSNSQINAAAGKPYLVIVDSSEVVGAPTYGRVDVLDSIVDVQIHQAATDKTKIPNASLAMKLYFDLQNAPKYVNAVAYGQPLIDMHREFGRQPRFNKESGGLFGVVRFRLLYPRG